MFSILVFRAKSLKKIAHPYYSIH